MLRRFDCRITFCVDPALFQQNHRAVFQCMNPMPFLKIPAKWRLGRDKPEFPVSVSSDDEDHRSLAQVADAVEYEDEMTVHVTVFTLEQVDVL